MSETKLILENWRKYLNEEQQAALLVEEICGGSCVTKLVLIEDQQRLLDEGIGSFFASAFSAVKGKIEDFNEWKEQKLMSFIQSAIIKIQNFFSKMRQIAKQAANKILLKLFTKSRVRNIVEAFSVLKRPQYLKFGASILATLLAKLAELGANAVLDAMTAGGATAAKIANFVRENIEKIKLFVEAVNNALDPTGIIEMLEKIPAYAEAGKILLQLKRDLQDPFKSLRNFPT